MATEKTPLLSAPKSEEVVIDMPYAEKKKPKKILDANNNVSIKESLTYEQLLPYIVDPYWIRVRKICFSLYCTTLVVILLAACISAYMSTSSCKVSLPVSQENFQGDKNFGDNNTDVVAALFSP